MTLPRCSVLQCPRRGMVTLVFIRVGVHGSLGSVPSARAAHGARTRRERGGHVYGQMCGTHRGTGLRTRHDVRAVFNV